MEIREWAIRILSADRMDEKLLNPGPLTDLQPGPPLIWKEPTRPPGMEFRTRSKEEKLPPLHDHKKADNRAICLHRFAGHELLAVEIMAYTLLAYPDAPPHFRRGLANTLKEEQGHVRMYLKRMKEMGLEFGDLPLFKHFWAHTPFILSPKHYVSIMNLTFEQANLDFAPIYGQSFARNGDEASAKLMAQILEDEIAHVKFGASWLKQFKRAEETEWEAWTSILSETLLTPKRGRGFYIHPEHRLQAGLSEEWNKNLAHF